LPLISNKSNIYIGRREGFMDNLENKIQGLVGKYQESDKKIIYGSINEVVNAFVKEIPKLME